MDDTMPPAIPDAIWDRLLDFTSGELLAFVLLAIIWVTLTRVVIPVVRVWCVRWGLGERGNGKAKHKPSAEPAPATEKEPIPGHHVIVRRMEQLVAELDANFAEQLQQIRAEAATKKDLHALREAIHREHTTLHGRVTDLKAEFAEHRGAVNQLLDIRSSRRSGGTD